MDGLAYYESFAARVERSSRRISSRSSTNFKGEGKRIARLRGGRQRLHSA